MSITGFSHKGRGVGVRDHQLILPSVVCSTHVSRKIANEVGAITFAHQNGCGIIGIDVPGVDNFFIDLANHPNVQSVLVVSLGCETIQGPELLPKINRELSRLLVIQESGGASGTYESGVRQAKQLRDNFKSEKARLDKLIVGLDLSRDTPHLSALKTGLTAAGFEVVVESEHAVSEHNLSKLMSAKAQVVISFPDENQPPTGFPLIPVINIAAPSPLHQALISEFDISDSVSLDEIVELVKKVADGQKSKSELSGIGEIVAPRSVRSV
jgi:altronate dehydratase large subunit